jgi:hypothetical protein
VFENSVLRRIFGSKRNEVTRAWKYLYLHNEELNDLYSSPTIVRVIKSRIMRWAVHVAHMGEGFGGKTERKSHWKNPDVDGKIILSRIFRKWDVRVRTGLRWLRIETDGGHS